MNTAIMLAWVCAQMAVPLGECPREAPNIIPSTNAELLAMRVNKEAEVLAIYTNNTIYILDSITSIVSYRVVIIHELTHHVQQNRHGDFKSACELFAREVQAYEIADEYQELLGLTIPIDSARLDFVILLAMCQMGGE
jgi:hypothetical protein